MFRKLLTALIIATLVLTACGGGSPAQSGAATPAKGQEVFKTNCGECHGDDGSGTDEAPALAGHIVDEVTKQVRDPEGDMEAISPDKLSDADLALIAQYVASLGGQDAHPDVTPNEEEKTHLMAAYEAIKDHENMDRQTAINHLEQAAALASGDATELYNEMVTAIKGGKAGNARHELKELLGLMEEH